jgi:phage tail protein X
VARGLTLCGVTTDGSALSPEPLREVFGKVRHHICQFHIVAEVVKAVVGAVASARKGLAATQPKLPKGRPSTPAAKAAARTKKRLAAQGAALFTQRYLFVQRHLNTTARKTLWRISRGLSQLRALRAVMEQVYALFDQRCRTQTALPIAPSGRALDTSTLASGAGSWCACCRGAACDALSRVLHPPLGRGPEAPHCPRALTVRPSEGLATGARRGAVPGGQAGEALDRARVYS